MASVRILNRAECESGLFGEAVTTGKENFYCTLILNRAWRCSLLDMLFKMFLVFVFDVDHFQSLY